MTESMEKSAFPDVVSNKDDSEELCALTEVFPTWYRWRRVELRKLVKLRWISKLFRYNRREYGQIKYLNPEWGYWWIKDSR